MKRIRLLISILCLIICLALLVFVVKFIAEGSYRSQLPEYPDFETISKSLQKQISIADRRAYFNPTTNNLGKLGMVYHSCAFYEKATQCYKLAIKKNDKKWIWSYYLGYLNMEQGESNVAIENFKQVIEVNPNNYLALFYTGETFQNLGLIRDAEKIFKKIASTNESDFDKTNTYRDNYFPLETYAMFRLARIYMNSDRLDSAEMTLLEIIDKQMTFGPAYRLLGNLNTIKGNLHLSNIYNIRANDLIDYAPPVDYLIDNIILLSRSDQYLLKQIEEAFRNSNFDWALKLCSHALKYNPDNKYLISNAIIGYLMLGYGEKALPYLEKHIIYFNDDFKELMNVADLLYDKGFKSQAMLYFNQAEKLEPGNSKLTLWLSERGMINDALVLLNKQLTKEPKNTKILSDAVHLLLNLGEKEMAITYLNKLKELLPSGTEVLLLTGMSEEKEGNLKEALSIYEEIYRNDPKDIVVIKYLANFYIRNKIWDKAINHFTSALNDYPNDPFLLEGLGRLLIFCPDQKLRDLNTGKEYSERAWINFNSSFATKISAGKNLAAAYAELGDREKAYNLMNITVNLARRREVTKDYLNYLESLLKKYSLTN